MDALTVALNRIDDIDIAGDRIGCAEPTTSTVSKINDQAGVAKPTGLVAEKPVRSFQSPENGYGANWSG